MGEIVYNEELWEAGFAYNCRIEGNSLHIAENGLYISGAVDSYENGTVWSRLSASYRNPGDSVGVSYMVGDYKAVFIGGGTVELDNFIISVSVAQEEKLALLSGLWADTCPDACDIPLLKGKGRYLWFMLRPSGSSVTIDILRIGFGGRQWQEYLPGVYQRGENSFLNRFLSMLQGVYSDLDREISDVSRLLDANAADSKGLEWLSGWVGAEDFSPFNTERLRQFVVNACRLSGLKGTRRCVSEAVELYTGSTPIIVETWEAALYNGGDFYGSSPWGVIVIVEEECLDGGVAGADATALARLLNYYSPAHSKPKISVLRPFMVLGQHTYLGINSKLSHREAFPLLEDGLSLV